jgi:hypothetical protein
LRELDFNAITDDTRNKMVGGNVGFQPSGAFEGLTFGAHGYASTVNAFDSAGALMNETRVRVMGGYAGYDENDWETFAEYYRFNNPDTTLGIKHRSTAWFVHAGHSFGQLTPYVRYEHASLDPNDPYFRSLRTGRSYDRVLLGARYALDPRSSIKFELSSTSEDAATLLDETGAAIAQPAASYRRANFQFSIAF